MIFLNISNILAGHGANIDHFTHVTIVHPACAKFEVIWTMVGELIVEKVANWGLCTWLTHIVPQLWGRYPVIPLVCWSRDTTCPNSNLELSKKFKTKLWMFTRHVFTFYKKLGTKFDILHTETKRTNCCVNSVILCSCLFLTLFMLVLPFLFLCMYYEFGFANARDCNHTSCEHSHFYFDFFCYL